MKILVIYDSFFGNTQKIAEEVKCSLLKKHTVILKNVADVKKTDLKDIDLFVMGSPTRAFNPSENITKFINELSLKTFNFAVFDTRIGIEDIPWALRFIFKIFGYADKRMVRALKSKGGQEILPSKGFLVKDKEGPLKKGELEKVKIWIKGV
jgi:flavodoxin I